MGELTASLAHEVKQPISSAMINAKTCLRWLGREDPDMGEAQEAVSRVVKDVTRASDIIGRISSLFKKAPVQSERVDMNELIREMAELVDGEASRYSISIRTEFAADLHTLGDAVQLRQVLMNLMLNGIDAMKESGRPRELTIKSQSADDHQILISISDTGCGLQPEQAEQMFNAFFTTKPQGLGMGLPISRSIIESHGGRLWFTANSRAGATFSFSLPGEVARRAASSDRTSARARAS